MKRNLKWSVAVLLVLTIIALLIFPIGKSFALPFTAEDVSSVILWSFWGYKEATDRDDIAMIVEEVNGTRLCGEFDFDNYEPRAGDYGCDFYFFMKDGRIYEYSTMPKAGLTSLFRDADGTCYKAKGISSDRILENLNIAYQSGNPFDKE